MSLLDNVYRSFLLSRFFTKGWGKPEHLIRIIKLRRMMGKREFAFRIVDPDSYPITITKDENHSDHRIMEGHFRSPFMDHAPDLVPKESQKAYFQVVLPLSNKSTPMVIHYAGTGDHYYWRRRYLMALPMLRERGISSIILENPFYGLRKPKSQVRSSLHNVTDLFIMGGSLMMESLVLYHWAERRGFGPLVSHGISMGGHMAALAASCWPRPIGLVPCLASMSASFTFTQGVMTGSIPWDLLEKQYASIAQYHRDIRQMVNNSQSYRAGVEYARTNLIGQSSVDYSLPFLGGGGGNSKLRREAMDFMIGILDECTHFRNFEVPVDPNLIIIVAAEMDAYQPKIGVISLPEIWPGAQMRFIKDKGHVESYLFEQGVFRQAIYDSIDKMIQKYPQKSSSL